MSAKIRLPMIHKVVPGLIASDLVGVQPMTGPVGSVSGMFTVNWKMAFPEPEPPECLVARELGASVVVPIYVGRRCG